MMAFVWCGKCKKHLVPKGVTACRACSSPWMPPDDSDYRHMEKGDWLLIGSVVVAALVAIVITAVSAP